MSSKWRRTAALVFIIIVGMMADNEANARQLPKDRIVEQGLHPNPGPLQQVAEAALPEEGSRRRRLRTKTAPLDAPPAKKQHCMIPPDTMDGGFVP